MFNLFFYGLFRALKAVQTFIIGVENLVVDVTTLEYI